MKETEESSLESTRAGRVHVFAYANRNKNKRTSCLSFALIGTVSERREDVRILVVTVPLCRCGHTGH